MPDLTVLIDALGDDRTAALGGLVIGMVFGGGWSVGAGMTGCSVLALTALVALAGMAAAAGLTDLLLRRLGQTTSLAAEA